ncbi:primosomal protein N' [Microbacterium sp. MEC084]|uniref:primosomal protein N' family DNA-binding protein n=1 Tax=Microbacterium sp. MEC084 TaxID=1963027 RepID=UPI00106F17F2|nr:primosomal protein N' [Microbacterium sp. MEC084]MCD1267316.1 primosomal protein N' [Microbacterium sp. MEC084]
MPRRVARVLIDSPLPQLDRLFDYAIPDELREQAVPGVRIKAPLRTAGRVVDGYVVEVGDESDGDRALSEIDAVVSTAAVLPERLYTLARRVADRAAGSAVDILRLAIPKRQVRVEKQWLAGERAPAPVVAADSLETARAVLDAYPGLAERIAAGGRIALDAPPRLEGARPAWTSVLAAAAAATLAAGRSAVLAVPDHRDLDLLHAALSALLPDDAVVRHDAGQTGPERYRGFLRTLEDAPCVVVGNRSAVYAPVARPGLLALWDDGDPLLEEPLAPYVHARDAALVRRELADPETGEKPALLLAGHTRSTDVERLVAVGWVEDVPPARRYAPRVVLSAVTQSERPGARIPSAAFRAAREGLAEGPVLVQVARPGYSPTLVCADCRAPARCRHCGGPLHAPGRGATPVCGWCGRSATAWTCPACSSPRVRLASSGSERTADELGRAFPGVRVIVADGAHPVREVDARPSLVVATRGAEPIAEGGYRAVLLLDGDRMLQAPELRIGESCLRWWSNAAALAAPDAPVHLVGVTGAVARALATWTQASYARAELHERAPLRMPPTARVARLEGDVSAVDRALATLRADVPELAADAVLGPVPIDRQGWPGARALVRFDYARGAAVATSLRASVVSEAVSARSARKGSARSRAPRNMLTARLDIVEPEL